jgi:hypothetical protein
LGVRGIRRKAGGGKQRAQGKRGKGLRFHGVISIFLGIQSSITPAGHRSGQPVAGVDAAPAWIYRGSSQ